MKELSEAVDGFHGDRSSCPPAESLHLSRLLDAALLREARLWKAPVFRNGRVQGVDVSAVHYQETIVWLRQMSQLFHFCPETFALGVSVLNRLLSTVKAQPKYLKCMSFTSLVLAAKVNEEDEVLCCVQELAAQSGCSFSAAEIVRMERIILDKLDWDLFTSTPVDFVHIFHALLVCGRPHLGGGRQKRGAGFQVALWSRQVQHCMACHQLWQFKGSTLALAIITLELEALAPDWFSVLSDLLTRAQVDSADFILCKETADQYLHSLALPLPANAVYILDGALIRDERARSPGRGRGHGEQGDSDDFYDGFRCLYEEAEGASPCPPLHPPISQ